MESERSEIFNLLFICFTNNHKMLRCCLFFKLHSNIHFLAHTEQNVLTANNFRENNRFISENETKYIHVMRGKHV